jgi:hypothetical protein
LALVIPGQGAELFDAETGAKLGNWSEGELPQRLRPRIPSALTWPR